METSSTIMRDYRAAWVAFAAATGSPRRADSLLAEYIARFGEDDVHKEWSGHWMSKLIEEASRGLCPPPPGHDAVGQERSGDG